MKGEGYLVYTEKHQTGLDGKSMYFNKYKFNRIDSLKGRNYYNVPELHLGVSEDNCIILREEE